MRVCPCVHRDERCQTLLWLVLQVVVNSLLWVLGILCWSSGRTRSALIYIARSCDSFVCSFQRFVCLYFYVCEYVSYIYVYIPGACGGQKRISWNWSYRWLWATKWVLGTKPRSSVRAASALHWAISPTTFSFWTNLLTDFHSKSLAVSKGFSFPKFLPALVVNCFLFESHSKLVRWHYKTFWFHLSLMA